MKTFIIFVLFSTLSLGYCQTNNYKLCLHTSDSINYCDQLNRETTAVQCIKAADSVECTQKVQNGEADFTVLFSEQAYLASGFEDDKKTSVIAEVRALKTDSQPHSFQMVVVVSKDHKGGLNGLRNKKYCHPGFSGHDLWTPRVLKEFEYLHFGEKIKRNCNEKENVSYVEQEIKVLDEFFGDSCRPGPWSESTELNDQLEKKYPKLTALCRKDLKEQDSLSCLKMQNADLAYTTLSDALTMPDKDNFRLLCQNDSLIPIPIRNGVPPICSWRNQPWPIVLSQRGKAGEIQNNLKASWIPPNYIAAPPGSPFSASGKAGRAEWQETLAKILLQDPQQYSLNILQDTPLIQDFFLRNNQKLESYVQSDCPMRWCTVNQKEQEKCEWFARASSYAGVEPQVSCVAGEHIYDCLLKIRQNNADIIAIDSNYGYLARKMGLSNLLYSENSIQDIASIIAVIPEDSTISSFKDLKNKKACFPEYRGLAWVSFIDSARRNGVMKNNCEFGKSVSDFFTEICAPGAKDNYHYRRNNEMYDKLCSLCSDNCESNENNKFFNNTGALSCLADKRADVAFVEWQAIENEPNLGNYKVLCDDGKVLTFDEYKTNTDSCSLSNTVDSEVIARHNDSRRTDYKLGLLKMDIQFGSEFKNEATFKLFKEFKGEKNLLFKENVLGVADGQTSNVYVQNYIKLFESVDKCANSGSIVQFSIITLLLASLIALLNRQMS